MSLRPRPNPLSLQCPILAAFSYGQRTREYRQCGIRSLMTRRGVGRNTDAGCPRRPSSSCQRSTTYSRDVQQRQQPDRTASDHVVPIDLARCRQQPHCREFGTKWSFVVIASLVPLGGLIARSDRNRPDRLTMVVSSALHDLAQLRAGLLLAKPVSHRQASQAGERCRILHHLGRWQPSDHCCENDDHQCQH